MELDDELLHLLGRMEVVKKRVLHLVDHKTDPYLLSDARRMIGWLRTDADACVTELDLKIKSLGYTWENTYSPEARSRRR